MMLLLIGQVLVLSGGYDASLSLGKRAPRATLLRLSAACSPKAEHNTVAVYGSMTTFLL